MEFEILDRNQVEIEPRKTNKQVEYETIMESIKNGKVYMPRADISKNSVYVLMRKLSKNGIKATWANDKKTGRIIVFQVE
jgi:hypothetical protein